MHGDLQPPQKKVRSRSCPPHHWIRQEGDGAGSACSSLGRGVLVPKTDAGGPEAMNED